MKAVALLSGGLDSRLAARLVLEQGVDLHALHCTSVFVPGEGEERTAAAREAAARLDIPLTIEDISEELVGLVKDSAHGLGSGVNPCVDCRILQLRLAADLMAELRARFVVTGEVVGQRPMSQRRGAMGAVEREAGLEGLVLRPLCALELEPAVPERRGWVQRERLKGFTGRRRTPQMELAEELGITDYPSPAGGCLLTDPGYARRARDLLEHGQFDPGEARLLKVGRHFRFGPRARLVVGRHEEENARIKQLSMAGDLLLEAADFPGPTSLARGEFDGALLLRAARITARYGKGRDERQVRVRVRGAECREMDVEPMEDEHLERWRI